MPADKTDFVLRLGERLDQTSARVSRVESDVLDVKRATHALTSTVDQLSSSVSELGSAWRSMAAVFGEYAARNDSWRSTTDQRLDRLEAAAFEPTR